MLICVEWGRLPVRTFEFELPENQQVQSVHVTIGEEAVRTTLSTRNQRVTLTLEEGLILTAGEAMAIEAGCHLE